MSPRKRRYFRNVSAALFLLLVAAWVVPSFLSAERYRPILQAGLERALHRRVSFGHITLHLFPQPGFTLKNVVIDEVPAFGLEPFARVQSIDCALLWRSVWHSKLEFGSLRLQHASINLVRNTKGEWNIENLLLNSGMAGSQHHQSLRGSPPPALRIEIAAARLNFKQGEDKKPFAIVDSRAHMEFDFSSRRLSFSLSGNPVRTDLELPTPGPVELAGTWRPDPATGGTLAATLRTRGALLYDWIPLVTEHNPGVYGVLDSSIDLSGTLRKIVFSGNARVSQLHHWEQLPPSNDMPCRIQFQGSFDRDRSSLKIADLRLRFAESEAAIEGAIKEVTSKPDFDLAMVLKQSRMRDLLRLGGRVLGKRLAWNVTGNVDGKLEMKGSWADRRYEGRLVGQAVRLRTPSGTFPISRVAIRIASNRIRLSPTKVRLAPGVEVVAAGTLRDIRASKSRRPRALGPRYDLTISSHSVSLGDLLRFGRALGLKQAENVAAEGIGSFTLHAKGHGWPLAKPNITAQAEIRSARLMVPSLTEPVNIPRARIQIYGKQVIVNPLVAVMGTSIFSGWLMHERSSAEPWKFNLKADKLSIGQGAQWFKATRPQASSSLLEKLSGIGALLSSRRPAESLLSRLKAQGQFATPILSYRALALRNVRAQVDIDHRTIQVSQVVFEAGNGRGTGKLLVDMQQSPALISGGMSMDSARLETLATYLPPALAKVRGRYAASGQFKAEGLTHEEIARSLQGRAVVTLRCVYLDGFDPISGLARLAGMETPEASPQPVFIPLAEAHLQIQNRQITLEDFPVDLPGAKVHMEGSCAFDGTIALQVHADLSNLPSGWFATAAAKQPLPRLADVRLAGSLRHLRVMPAMRLSQKQP